MKPKSTLRSFLLLAGSSLLAASSLHAATLTWDANGATAGQTDGAGAWLDADQWWTGSANTTWTSGDDAIFGWGGAGGAVTLASPTTVGSLTFKYFTGTYTLGTGGQAITLNNGITRIGGNGGNVAIGGTHRSRCCPDMDQQLAWCHPVLPVRPLWTMAASTSRSMALELST